MIGDDELPLAAMLPPGVASAVVNLDRFDLQRIPFYRDEALLVRQAVAKRQREFLAGRWCARSALKKLGYEVGPILSETDGFPLWPAGVVGSISHNDHWSLAVVTAGRRGIGVDIETCGRVNEKVLQRILTPIEEGIYRSQTWPPFVNELFFGAKEAVIKLVRSAEGGRISFTDIAIKPLIDQGQFSACLPQNPGHPTLSGTFWSNGEVIVTAVVL